MKLDWFFSHRGSNKLAGGLPLCPCSHKHNTLEAGAACARNRQGIKGTLVREVRDGVAVVDHPVVVK